MNKIKIIKTENEYNEALTRIDERMGAVAGSPEAEELELLVLLVEKYEQEHFPIEPPDAVEAIQFRMDQEGFTARDMVPYLGSQSRVSEVLNRKRPLSLKMIRNLHRGLGIPLESLIQETTGDNSGNNHPELEDMVYYYHCQTHVKPGGKESIKRWYSNVLENAQKQDLPAFDREKSGKSLIEELFHLCDYSAGPKMAQELLNKKGIQLIIQKKTGEIDLDGGCIMIPGRNPIIALTMQKNGLDEFWYLLLHLIAHVALHQQERAVVIFDSIECSAEKDAPQAEIQANEYLKSILESANSLKKTRQSYQKAVNLSEQKKNIQTTDISPEQFLCWYRIENQGRTAATRQSPTKKISDKLDVYSA